MKDNILTMITPFKLYKTDTNQNMQYWDRSVQLFYFNNETYIHTEITTLYK